MTTDSVAVASADLLESDLRERVAALGLESNVAELRVRGYTVVQNAAPMEFFDQLRARILELVDEQDGAGVDSGVLGYYDKSAWLLLGRGRVFEQAVCNPVLVTLNEVMLGKGFQLQVCGGTVKGEGSPAQPLHCDAGQLREPFGTQPFGLTSLWACDDWTAEGGATRIVPGSFQKRRSPVPGEEPHEVPIEFPKGSIMFWDAAMWHHAGEKTTPGLRVGFHTPCTHLSMRTLESYDHLSDEVVDRNPPVFGRMIGRQDAYGKQTETVIPFMELARMMQWSMESKYL
jgi:hypothetical protein